MGATFCEIHGVTGKIRVCPHIHNYVNARTKGENLLPSSTLEEVTIFLAQFLLFPDPLLAYCSKCAKQNRLPTGSRRLKLKLLINFNALIYLHRIDLYECGVCFYEQIFQITINNADTPPLINQTTKVVIPK